MKTPSWSAGIALLILAVCVPSAGATTTKCQRTIAKAGAQFVQAKVKALSKCEDGLVKGKINDPPGPCSGDTKTTAAITKASDKLAAAIGKSCGGDDKVCGGDLTGEDTPAALGWPTGCPNFEKGNCLNAIADCGDITTCLACIGGAAVDQAIALYYDDLAPNGGDKALIKCQTSIGKAASAFLSTKTKILQKCWDARLNGKHNNSCAPPAVGDGKYLAKIDKAENKKIATISKACGGADKAVGGGDDFPPAAIGFPATCPSVTIPGATSTCDTGPITDLQDIIECVDCVTEFKADCVDQLQVPEYTGYPNECYLGVVGQVCTAEPAPSGSCPTLLEFNADGPEVDLDAGFSGLGHNSSVPTNGRLTLTVSGCAGTQPTCGQCTVSGPLPNAGGVTFNNQRCSAAPWIPCSTNPDCTGFGSCVFYFGAPLPTVAGGVSTCIVNQVSGSVTGTINLDDGTSITNVPLASTVHPTGTTYNPCPTCVAGLCTDGPRIGQACAVNGTGIYGDVSLDCPPNPGSAAGTLTIPLNISTGTQTTTVSALNPTCRQTGYTGLKCVCDTCNNANADACSTNADCPDNPPATPGICGGRRCIGGLNAGAPCAVASACPGGGQCNRPGEPTQPNACLDDSTTAEVGCVDQGNNEGLCPDGPVELVCSVQTFISCLTDFDCSPESDARNFAGQVCIGRNRSCFVNDGIIGNSTAVSGNPDAPCGGLAVPTVGTFFCIAPVSSSAVNAATGLPGLGRVLIPSTTILSPWN